MILGLVDVFEFDAELIDLRPVDVFERVLGARNRVVRGVVEALGARADQRDFLEYHRTTYNVRRSLKRRGRSPRSHLTGASETLG